MSFPRKEKQFVWIVSGIIGILLAGTALASVFYFKLPPMIFSPDDLLFLALIIALFPPATVNYLDGRWRAEVDRRIPEFLMDLSEAGRTGVTLTRAVEMSSKKKYGPLSKELQRVVTLISWGKNLDDALKEFSERVDTRLARRAVILIMETNRSGGNVQVILETVSSHINELQTIEEERKAMIRPYIGIVYIAFFIFVFIDIMLVRTFFSQIEELQSLMAESGGLFLGQTIKLSQIQRIMFHLAVVEGLFGGLIAGKMGEGSMGDGLKHSLIMMVAGFITFFFLVWHPII